MGTPNDVSLSIMLVADYGSKGKGVAAWDHKRCLNYLSPTLGVTSSSRAVKVLSVC